MKPRVTLFGTFISKTFQFKLLSIAATVLLAVTAVVVSVHSSGPRSARADNPAEKSRMNSQGDLKTKPTAAAHSVAVPLAPLAPIVTASKSDSLANDVDGDLQADPGDTLKYTVNLNSIGGDATGLTFTDTVDPNTMFVGGSLTATPVAVDDSYTATGNIRISVAAPGVLGNDFTGVPAATITAPPVTSTNGGDVSLAADGSFTYNPPAGFEGVDTFSYTLTNASGSNNATVSITVSGMIWFIDNNAAACTTLAAGCGRLTNPFSSLAAFAALNNGSGNNPAANDNIFVYESAGDYAGPVTLLNGQRFIGQDATASLSSITGLTPPSGSDPLPTTNSANGTIVNITTGNAITVASGNTLTGFTGGNSTTDITGSGFGTLTISAVTLNGTGQALNLSTGNLAATFGSISSTNSGTTGISLTGVGGSLTSPTTTITNPTGIGISVGTSSATLGFGNTNSSSSGSAGVSLVTNTGAITFGSLDISPDANQRGLLATDNSGTITSTSGTINAPGATAVEITRGAGTTPLVISQTSVSSSGGAPNGIILTNTSGSFTVVGTGAAGSGGTIANKTGADGSTTQGTGIFLNNATNVSLAYMSIQGHQNHGIRGSNVTGFVLDNSAVGTTTANGTSSTADVDATGFQGEGSVRFFNLLGSATISNSTLDRGFSRTIAISNNSGTLNRLTISNSTVRQSLTSAGASDSFFAQSTVSATLNFTITGASIFNATRQFHVNSIATGASTMDIQINGACAFSNTINPVSAGGGLQLGSSGTDSLVTFNITGNSFRHGTGGSSPGVTNVGRLLTAGQVTGNGKFDGKIINNTFGVSGIARTGSGDGADAIGLFASGSQAGTTRGTGTLHSRFLVRDNSIKRYGEVGLFINARQGNSILDATVFGNTINEPGSAGAGAFAGIWANSGALGADTNTVNIVIGSQGTAADKNTMQDSDPNNFSDVFLENDSGALATFNLFRNGSAAGTVAGVLIDDNNPTLDLAGATSGTINLVGGTPPTPLFAADFGKGGSGKPGAGSGELPGSFDGPEEDVLGVAAGENPEKENLAKLTQSDLSALMPAAIERWRAMGISAEDLGRLQAVAFEIADLPEGQLASATTTSIKIEETGAGWGWYSDLSPLEDSEFDVPVPGRELQSTEQNAAFGRVDLLTVVMRELGVVYRQNQKKGSLPKHLQPLMENTLSPAVRRLPDARNIQLPSSTGKVSRLVRSGSRTSTVAQTRKGSSQRQKASVASSPGSLRNVALNQSAKRSSDRNSKLMHHAPRNTATAASLSMLADVMLNIGTLPAGESVTITFNVTVNDPFGGAMAQVSNQGTVSGSNFADVLTDDPSVGGTADPTVTPIDLPDVSVAVSPASVAEDGATNLVYTFTRNGSTANALTVNFSIGGTANFGASPNDYTQTGAATFTPPTGTVTFGAGNSTATVTVNPETDATVEPDETVVLTVTSGTGYDVGSPSSASGTITNDDTDVSIAVAPASVAEDGATNLVYTFTRAGLTTNSLTVNFSVGGTANFGVSPDDYTQTGATTFTPPTGTVTFGPGNSTATVTVDPEADSTVESDETVVLTVTAGGGYNVASPSAASGTITNDDTDVSVAVSPASVAEDGATNLVYTFTRAGVTTNSLTVNFSVGGSANFGVSPNDYTQTGATSFTPPTGTVTFAAGSPTATVTIDPEADSTVEPDETVDLTVTAGAGYNVGSPSSASGTITNDDTDVSVAVSPASVAEDGATNLVYTFTRVGVTSSSLTVNFSVGGSASFGASPNDYTQTGADSFSSLAGTVTFNAGNSTATVTVNPETDTTVEPDETVDLTVTAGAGYNVGSPSSASGTITNDDTDVSIAVSPASVAEDGATNLVYTFTRVGVTSGALTVNFSVGGTANFGVSPNDYTQTGATSFTPPTGTVTFGAGNSTATVTVDPETDTTIEADETVILTVTSGAGYNVSSPSSASGTITNDDADVSVAVAPAAVAEDGATNLVYTFTRTGFTAGALTVNFSVGGTATFGVSPDDYTQTGATTFTTTTGSATFSPGSPTATVTVNPETDTTAEADETVIITLTAGASYNAVSPNSATGTILNDDTLVSVVVSPSSTAEGGANLVYTFSRTGPTTSALAINFSVGGTASFPADYTQSGATTFTPPTATVTFGAGSATATVTVTPLTDCAVEGSETVAFTVQPGTGYGVGSPSSASGTITNTPDSVAPTITLIPNVNKTLWPPNHQYESIAVTDFVASASDNCDPSVNVNSVYILKITSDEPENGNGDGNTLNDIVIGATCKTAQLRAERDGSADGRVYTITFKVKDSFGNFSTATARVTVRKNPNSPAVDSGTVYTVNSSCP